jgi:hypothetical protein
MRFNRRDGGVPAAAWLFLALTLVRFSISWWNPATIAFVLTGIWVTLLGMNLGFAFLGPAHSVDATVAVLLIPWALQFGALVALGNTSCRPSPTRTPVGGCVYDVVDT